MAADLHCHTKLSDGSVGIEDLIVIAQKSGIETIAITDHDCLAGTVRGQVIGKRYGVNVIPGVELSAFDNEAGKKVHILCYLADTPDRLEGLCKRTSVARKRAGQIMMLKVAARFPISTEFIIGHASGSTNLFKQHIMHALMDAGYTDKIFGDLYYALFSPDSETNLLAPTKYPDVKEVIDEIHGAGGIAVLAHPAFLDNYDEIIIGSPVWWYSITPVVREFLKENNLEGKTVIPFATNAGWLGGTFKEIEELCKNSSVTNEMNIVFGSYSDDLVTSMDEINNWINTL